jgi:hypothetical protein
MDDQERLAETRRRQALAEISEADRPEHMRGADAYLVEYEDGTTETHWGYSIRMVADSCSDPHHEPVKIERVRRPAG